MTTRMTKSGQPVQGTTLEVWTTNGKWEKGKVVGKGWSDKGSADLVLVILEWEDGHRERAWWPELEWRPIP